MDKDFAARLRDRRVPRYFGDDPGFLEIVEFFVWRMSGLKPEDLLAIRVDNWFDRKWLGFSGQKNDTLTLNMGDDDLSIPAPRPVWRGLGQGVPATLPPFVPNRIVRETHLKAVDGWVSRTGHPERVHPLEKAPSKTNLDRPILSSFTDAVFIWFSSRSEANGRGTIMIYLVRDASSKGSWSSYLRKERWQVDRTVNVDRDFLVDELGWLSEDKG